MSKPIVISVLGDVKDLTSKLGTAEGRLGRFGGAMGKAGKVAAAGLAVAAGAAVALGVKVAGAASDAQQSMGATETVFGKYADTVVAKSDEAARAVGLSANAYRENSNLLGSLLKNQGVAVKDLAGETDNLIGISADLAATYGGTTTTAVEAMSAAYKGEFNQLEKYGISLKASTVAAELAARGQDKLTGAALDAAKQQATTDLITRQAGDALGAFGRESGTLAHQQQVLGAQVDNLSAKAGAVLLPVLTNLAMFANNTLVPGLERLGPPLRDFAALVADKAAPLIATLGDYLTTRVVPALASFGGYITGTIVPALVTFAGFLAANVVPVLASVGGFIMGSVVPALASFGGYLLGTVVPAVQSLAGQLAANLTPIITAVGDVIIGRVVPAATAIIAKFREWAPAIKSTAAQVGAVIGFLANLATTILGKVLPPVIRFAGFLGATLVPVVLTVIGVVGRIIGAVVNFGAALVGGVKDLAKFAGAVSDKVGAVLGYFRDLPGKITGALSNAGTLLKSIGEDLVNGLIKGLDSGRQWIIDKISSLGALIPGWLKKRLGIASPSKVTTLIGRQTGEGLALGLASQLPALRGVLDKAADLVAGTVLDPGLAAAGRGTLARRSRLSTAATATARTAPARVTVTLGAEQLHDLERGRRLALELRPYLAAGGTL